MNCYHCGATVDNGLALCGLCQMKASTHFEFLPVYFANLARWRPGRAGSRPVPSSKQPTGIGNVADDRISRALDEAGTALVGWAECLHDDRGIPIPESDGEADSVVKACRMLNENLTSVATLSWCGDMLDETTFHEAKLRALTMQAAPGWYAGECRTCTAPTYVVPGLTWVTCRDCGTTTYARDHLDTIIDEARGWVARPMRLAEAIVALVDTEASVPRLHKRISKWGERGRIETVRLLDADGDEVGPKRYRLGEVLDALFADGATRTGDVEAGAA